MSRCIVLVGPMGAGKTTFGKKLAKKLQVPFVDTDKLVASNHGAISKIFATKGEEHFRTLETQALSEALESSGIVATGGGVVLSQENRNLLADHFVVFLDTSQESVIGKINLDRRPLLKDNPDEWGRIYRERKSLYEEVSDQTVFTGDRSIRQIMKDLEGIVDGKFV